MSLSVLCLVVMIIVFAPITQAVVTIPAGDPITLTWIEIYLVRIANWLIVVSMVFAVIWFIWAGIRYMTGGDKPEAAKKMLWNGVIGTLIILGVGVIIRTIMTLVDRSFFRY